MILAPRGCVGVGLTLTVTLCFDVGDGHTLDDLKRLKRDPDEGQEYEPRFKEIFITKYDRRRFDLSRDHIKMRIRRMVEVVRWLVG